MSQFDWLTTAAGFDPGRWFTWLVCTNRGGHAFEVVGAVFEDADGLRWSPRTEQLSDGEKPAHLDQAERDEILEWTQYTAKKPIRIDGVPAFRAGDAVPTSHVERGVVSFDLVHKHPPAWPALARVHILHTRLDAEQVQDLRLAGVQGWAAMGRGSYNILCPQGCTPRIPREVFEQALAGAHEQHTPENVDLSRLSRYA